MNEEVVRLAAKAAIVLKDDQKLPDNLDNVPHSMNFDMQMLGPGEVHSAITGKGNITVEDVVGLHDSYNFRIKEAYNELVNTRVKRVGATVSNINIQDSLGENVLKDHNEDFVDHVVGHVRGLLRLEGTKEHPELWGTLKVSGKENVIKVLDGRYSNLSVGFSRKPAHIRNDMSLSAEQRWPIFNEISFVQKGAYKKAKIRDGKVVNTLLLSSKREEGYNPQIEIIKLVHKQLDFIDIELDNLQETRKIKSELNRLAFNGKVLPKLIRNDKILNELLSIKDKRNRQSVLDLLNMMPNHLCLGGETNSLNAIKGMEMIMAGDKNAAQKATEYYEEIKLKFYNASEKEREEMTNKLDRMRNEVKCSSTTAPNFGSVNTVEGEVSPRASIMPNLLSPQTFKFEGGEDEYLSGMEKLMAEGKNEEAKEYHSAYKKHRLEGKTISNKDTEELAGKEEKLSAIKEELKVVLSEALKGEMEEVNLKLSGLSTKVESFNSLAEQHKSLISFIENLQKPDSK